MMEELTCFHAQDFFIYYIFVLATVIISIIIIKSFQFVAL
jgi:hypothetical protein